MFYQEIFLTYYFAHKELFTTSIILMALSLIVNTVVITGVHCNVILDMSENISCKFLVAAYYFTIQNVEM